MSSLPPSHAGHGRPTSIKVRLRVACGEDDAFGPGKAQLLESLLQTGSLNRTATEMKMSYVKALSLVRAMNTQFRDPLVEMSRGGRQGGGTRVTALGSKVLAEYHEMREATEAAAQPGWRRLRKLLRPAEAMVTTTTTTTAATEAPISGRPRPGR